MHERTRRLRRAAVTALVAVGAVGGTVAAVSGVAAAATPTMTITPTSLPAATTNTSYSQTLTATEGPVTTAGTDTVDWSTSGTLPPGVTLASSTSSITTSTSASSTTTDTLSGTPTTPGTYSFSVTATDATTGATATNPYTVTVSLAPVNASGGQVVLSPSGASAATILPGKTGQSATSWTFGLANTFVAGQSLVIDIGPNGTTRCQNSTNYVAFAGTPTVTVSTNGTTETEPTFTATVATQANDISGCSADALDLALTNTSSTGSTPWTVTISNITYSVGSATTPGTIGTAGVFTATSSTSYTDTVAANATVATTSVTADNPPVSLSPSAVDQAISNIVITEEQPGTVPSGIVTVTLGAGTFDKADSPTVTTSPTGSGAGTATTPTGAGSSTLSFTVVASTSVATTYTLGNLAVDAPSTPGPVDVTVTDTPTTGSAVTLASGLLVYNVAQATRVYGQTADGTAAAELEQQFPPTGSSCVGSGSSTGRYAPVVLATDVNYPDALAASYLASYLHTGILLTPVNSVSQVTLNALRVEGITNVYVVGGPYVVSDNDIAQLKATPAYNCGGTQPITTLLGSEQDLSVTRIYGQTEYDTAQDIAEYPPASNVGTLDVPGAYAGQYNATTGNESSAPPVSTSPKTAILATSQGFQDAESASALAYGKNLPVLITAPDSLSSQAQSALSTLGIQQVIVMGGPIAISDSVVSTLMGEGMAVIRIAGQDYTQTATELADFEVNNQVNAAGQAEGVAWNPKNTIVVARGDFYSDGLAGSVITGSNDQPLLLTENPSTVGQYLTSFLQQAGSSAGIDGVASATTNPQSGAQITTLTILGGPLAVTDTTVSQLEADLGG
jgi:putative cell wall-binding protein/phage terminase large subunit-like protein